MLGCTFRKVHSHDSIKVWKEDVQVSLHFTRIFTRFSFTKFCLPFVMILWWFLQPSNENIKKLKKYFHSIYYNFCFGNRARRLTQAINHRWFLNHSSVKNVSPSNAAPSSTAPSNTLVLTNIIHLVPIKLDLGNFFFFFSEISLSTNGFETMISWVGCKMVRYVSKIYKVHLNLRQPWTAQNINLIQALLC